MPEMQGHDSGEDRARQRAGREPAHARAGGRAPRRSTASAVSPVRLEHNVE